MNHSVDENLNFEIQSLNLQETGVEDLKLRLEFIFGISTVGKCNGYPGPGEAVASVGKCNGYPGPGQALI
ncbi:MAG: hypothetical protein WBB28_00630 [Crinalium sp.]